ncbi:hypothetical protein ABZP36_016569 [Zizania latifolia]
MASAPSVVQEEQPLQPEPEPGTEHFSSQLAAAVRSISWSYAIFWSISTSRSGVLTWNDGFYNGDIKTWKITNSATELTSDQLVLQRSKQLRELYDALVSGECDHRARRPVTALSPEDLGDTEWYYVVCMTYVFRPGQGLPGKSFASNRSVWLCNAQSADRKSFPRSLLAKSASVQEDKTSVLAETIAYVRELEKRVQQLESSIEISRREIARKNKVSSTEDGGRRCRRRGGGSREREHIDTNMGPPFTRRTRAEAT